MGKTTVRYLLFPAAILLAACTATPPPDSSAVHSRVLTLDTHLDTPLLLMRPGFDFSKRNDPLRDLSQVDLPRIAEGELDAGFFAVFLSQGPLTPERHSRAKRQANAIFDRIEAVLAQYPDRLGLATSAAQVRDVVASGRMAVLIGIENGYALGGEVEQVEHFANRGTRYIGLVHSSNNALADSATDADGPMHGGLSPLGFEVVAEMNRLGIMIDISHASDDVVRDVLNVSSAPIIASHSSARAVYDHPRNLPDDLLRGIAAKGGVVQVNTLGGYLADLSNSPERDAALGQLRAELAELGPGAPEAREKFWAGLGRINAEHPPPKAALSDVLDHIDHLVQIMGIDHVGVGSDFDGGGGVAGFYHVGEIPNLTAGMIERGYSEDEIGKIWSGNLLRVMEAADARRIK